MEKKKVPKCLQSRGAFDGWKALCLLRAQGYCCGLNCTSPKFRATTLTPNVTVSGWDLYEVLKVK